MSTPRRSVPFLLLLVALGACGGGAAPPGGEASDVAYLRAAGGPADEAAFSIATFADGSCVVTGRFEGTATWGAGEPNATTLNSAGSADVFVARYNPDGTLAWAKRAGGTLTDIGYGVAAVPDGSCIVAGAFADVATFGPGETNMTMLDDTDDMSDAFVARYNPDGTLAWARRAGRDGYDGARDVSALPDGSSVITGSYNLIAVFGPGEANLTVLNSAGGDDVFVARYQPDGDLSWAVSAGGAWWDSGTGVDLLDDGSSLVCGTYRAPSATFGPGELNQTTLPAAGLEDSFVARYNPDGTLAWVRPISGASLEMALSISAYPDGGSVVSGFFHKSTVFGAGEPNQTTLTSVSDSTDVFLARYATDGSLLWARRAGGGENGEGAWSVAAHTDGGCAMTGNFAGIAAFDPGGPGETFVISQGDVDVFVARYDAAGVPLWVRTAGSAQADRGYGVAVHGDASLAACGSAQAPAVFNPGQPGEAAFTGSGGEDIFVVRYNADGGL